MPIILVTTKFKNIVILCPSKTNISQMNEWVASHSKIKGNANLCETNANDLTLI